MQPHTGQTVHLFKFTAREKALLSADRVVQVMVFHTSLGGRAAVGVAATHLSSTLGESYVAVLRTLYLIQTSRSTALLVLIVAQSKQGNSVSTTCHCSYTSVWVVTFPPGECPFYVTVNRQNS